MQQSELFKTSKMKLMAAADFLALGLDLDGWPGWRNCSKKTKRDRFKRIYGAYTLTCESLWKDMQISTKEDCRLDDNDNPKHLLLCLRFFWEYATEDKLCGCFQIRSEKTVRKWCRIYARRIHLLLPNKVRNRKT